jgi:hypothetical protein
MMPPKLTQYPKTIEVRDEVYQVRIVGHIPGEEKGTFGLCDPAERIIWLRKGQSRKGLMRTFIHELLHAIESEYNVKLKHKRINILEGAIVDFLVDNFK